MKRVFFVCLFLCLTTSLLSQSNPVSLPIGASQADPKNHARILDQYGKVPLTFEANHGQTDARVKFLSRTSGYSLFLTDNEAVLEEMVRFRTVGDADCTGCVESMAESIDLIVAEVAGTRLTERGATRADDRISEAGMEDRKREGYF